MNSLAFSYKTMLKALFNSLLAVSISSASLIAGSVSDLTTTESSPTEEEGLSFGAPHLEFFTRSQSTTSKLPGLLHWIACLPKAIRCGF